eukprot:NODE_524_length_7257_cov_0.465912.p1 type:complete len:1485 gc:universal NODE_524_length_7257_cov_0.465912:865-5319(+)
MKQVSILGNESITIGFGLHNAILDFIGESSFSTIAVISDITIEELGHLKLLLEGMDKFGKRILSYCIPDGELFKTRETKENIEDFLLSNKCHRDTLLIALGGGVVGDLVGFTASTYMRGVPVVQIPTTLLAMVDSSVGGKTGLDTVHGKNLIGAFHQPLHIFIDVMYLSTLPIRQFCNGMAEVIKTAAIANSAEFAFLEEHADSILKAVQNPIDANSASLLTHVVMESVKVKANIVTEDEKESGLRGLLNFGHTVGHGIEAAVFPNLLHGECVSLGMVIEGEISRYLNHLSNTALGRLERLLSAFQLPTDFFKKSTRTLFKGKDVKFNTLMDFIYMDKKNAKSNIKICLLKDIGSTVELKATAVDLAVIKLHLCKGVQIHPFKHTLSHFVCKVPGSKSISNRVLIMAALGKGTVKIHNFLHSEDTQVMLHCLKQLKACSFEYDDDLLVITGNNGLLTVPDDPLFISNAGTAARFLTTMLNLCNGTITLTGNDRMRLRPIHPLVDALVNCDIQYLEKRGFLPLRIAAKGLSGGLIELDAKISSQYVSSILISAPYAKSPILLKLAGTVISKQYIDMTCAMMKSFGVMVNSYTDEYDGNLCYEIPVQHYVNPCDYVIEPDASSATYPLSFAAITNTTVTIPHLTSSSCQGDALYSELVLKAMNCTVEQNTESTTVSKDAKVTLTSMIKLNMEILTDAFLTAAVINGVCSGSCTITGIANQRVKECNRISAIREGLQQFNIQATELDDGIVIHGNNFAKDIKRNPIIECHEDHRVAMSFSLLGCLYGCILNDRKCVGKTYPEWFDVLGNIFHVELSGYDIEEDTQQDLSVSDKSKCEISSVYLIGMRGVGKSTLGKMHANRMSMKFVDVDVEISNAAGTNISEYVELNGWEKFRELENRVLRKIIQDHPFNSVVACGGGICTYEPSRLLLQKCFVILITNPTTTPAATINRPAYNDSFEAVYASRIKDYQDTCNYEYIGSTLSKDTQYFTEWLNSATGARSDTFTKNLTEFSNFVCCTLPDYTFVNEIELLSSMDASNMVEIRIDHVNDVGRQLFYLQQLLHAVNKPIIATLRSVQEGGKYEGSFTEYYQLLMKLIKWNIPIIDVEYNRFKRKPLELDVLIETCLKYKVDIICSWHEQGTQTKWDDMKYIANKMQQIGLVKIIGAGNDIDGLIRFKEWFRNQYNKPLICCLMGSECQYSRVISKIVPITHGLYTKAALGQMTLKEINRCRVDLGLVNKSSYYLIGYPISSSPSPVLHNTGFNIIGLPHQYKILECKNVDNINKLLQQSDFGGCSITIPLKEDMMAFCDEIDADAKNIGAINTIIKRNNRLVGYNTDYKGIMRCGDMLANSSINKVLVIGAGGTARAACYAVQKWGVSLYIWNRTISKGEILATRFNGTCLDKLEGEYDMIISTIPYKAQVGIKIPNAEYLIDLSYSKEETTFMKVIKQHIRGIDVLLEQGYCQFELFTNMKAPKFGMKKAVLAEFNK